MVSSRDLLYNNAPIANNNVLYTLKFVSLLTVLTTVREHEPSWASVWASVSNPRAKGGGRVLPALHMIKLDFLAKDRDPTTKNRLTRSSPE